jgi:hypothetical protein
VPVRAWRLKIPFIGCWSGLSLDGVITKNKFREHLEPLLEKRRRNQHLTEPGAKNIRDKGEQLINLFVELDKRDLLRSPDEIDFKRIGNVLKNFDEVNRLNATLLKFYKENKGQDRTRTAVLFKDDGGRQYSISVKQLVIQWGWAYCSLCEVMKTMMTELVRFPTKPTGIGEVKLALERSGGLDLSFFDFVDPGVRNSFFHLDFCLAGGDISVPGRREPLKVTELMESAMQIDAIIFPLIGIIQIYINKKD